jgi:hypothetical protein
VLHAVAVVRIDVDVGDAQPVLAQSQDGQHGVVDVAEARGPIRKRMVQPAPEMERAIDRAARHEIRRRQGAGGDQLRDLPETAEHRVVAQPQPVHRAIGGIEAAIGTLENVQIFARVIAGDVGLRRGLWTDDPRVR